MPIQNTEMDLRNKTTSEIRTVFHSPLDVPNSQVRLYMNIKSYRIFREHMSQKEHVHSKDHSLKIAVSVNVLSALDPEPSTFTPIFRIIFRLHQQLQLLLLLLVLTANKSFRNNGHFPSIQFSTNDIMRLNLWLYISGLLAFSSNSL